MTPASASGDFCARVRYALRHPVTYWRHRHHIWSIVGLKEKNHA